MHRDSNHEQLNDSLTELEQLRRRQTLRIALALFLVWIALTASSNAAGPCETPNTIGLPIQLDGFTPSPVDTELAAVQSRAAAYVQLHAVLSNFDRDANADGWRVSVVLRSHDGSILVAPSQATFEILELANLARVDRFGRNSASYPFVPARPTLTWTRPLEFNEHGVVALMLPATPVAQQRLGWDSTATLHRGILVADNHLGHSWSGVERGPRHNHFATLNLLDELDFPRVGWLRVRVTIPGQGTLEAVAPIDLRPAVLVDTFGRYR